MALIAAHLKLMQKSFWWCQCSDRYIISLFPHLHTPFSPSLISLKVSVDVIHHGYLLYIPPLSISPPKKKLRRSNVVFCLFCSA